MARSKSVRLFVSSVLVLAISGVFAENAFAEKAVAVVVGAQGWIQGDEVSKNYHPGSIALLAVGYALTSPSDPLSGLPTGRVRHSPLQVTKLPDKSSPKLITALARNENLNSVEIKFYRTVASTGAVVHYHTFKLSNARISEFRTSGDTNAPNGVIENISFVYEKITITDHVNNFVTEAYWNEQL